MEMVPEYNWGGFRLPPVSLSLMIGVSPSDREWMEPVLAAAFATGSKTADQVFEAIYEGSMQAWMALGRGGDRTHGLVVTSVGTIVDSEILALWVVYAAGWIAGGPKQRLRTMRALMGQFEAAARLRKCKRVRVEAGRWDRVLPDYVRDGNILEKVL